MRNVYELRRRIGVVFPLPVGLPLSIYDKVALAPRLAGIKKKRQLDEIVERCLHRAALYDEVRDRLNSLGSLLSGGQQQRLIIARALSQEPELLCLDEFSIAVDPVTTMRIEDVLKELRSINRINERLGYVRTEGRIDVIGNNIYAPGVNTVQLRKKVGMVFQRPNPLPVSIRDNILYC